MIDNSEIQIMQIAQMLGIKFEHPLAEISPLIKGPSPSPRRKEMSFGVIDDQIKLGKRQKELVKELYHLAPSEAYSKNWAIIACKKNLDRIAELKAATNNGHQKLELDSMVRGKRIITTILISQEVYGAPKSYEWKNPEPEKVK